MNRAKKIISGVALFYCGLAFLAALLHDMIYREGTRSYFWLLAPVAIMALGIARIIDSGQTSQVPPNHVTGAAETAVLKPTWFLVGAVLLGLGLLIIWEYSLPMGTKVWQARHWTETPCTILSSEVSTSHDPDDSDTHSPSIRYRYSVSGKTFESDVIDFLFAPSGNQTDAEALIARYPAGSETLCYVNPAKPAEATLWRGYKPMQLCALMPLFPAGLGLAILIGAFRHRRTCCPSVIALPVLAPPVIPPVIPERNGLIPHHRTLAATRSGR